MAKGHPGSSKVKVERLRRQHGPQSVTRTYFVQHGSDQSYYGPSYTRYQCVRHYLHLSLVTRGRNGLPGMPEWEMNDQHRDTRTG